MNPENRGEHVNLHHSSLWREPIFNEKPLPMHSNCHVQLNSRIFIYTQWESLARVGLFATIKLLETSPQLKAVLVLLKDQEDYLFSIKVESFQLLKVIF